MNPALAMTLALALGLAAAGGADGPPVGAAPGATRAKGGLVATRTLVARLAAVGRGEAALTLTRHDPMGGPALIVRGRLALEPPDRVRLDFPTTGERIAVRREGGEWIQPAARQMVRLKPEQTDLAAGLWEVFLSGGNEHFTERRVGGGRFVLEARAPEEGLPGSIHVALDARGLPAALEMTDASGDSVRYAFRAWRFTRASGAEAFVLQPPPGYAVVDLP